MSTDLSSDMDLPVIPVPRAAHCPLHPPAEFVDWRQEPGLRRVMYHGRPAWVVSRYHDIRAALVDPRLSADTIPEYLRQKNTDNTPVMFARVDDPEHHRLRRMLTGDFTFRRCEAMRPRIQELVDHHLDVMIRNGPPADLVRDFALPVPSLVIALLLGCRPRISRPSSNTPRLGWIRGHPTTKGTGRCRDVRLPPGIGGAQGTGSG